MRASISMSDLGVFLAEPVLARYQTLNGGEVHKDANILSVPQSSSASRRTASHAGFLFLTHYPPPAPANARSALLFLWVCDGHHIRPKLER